MASVIQGTRLVFNKDEEYGIFGKVLVGFKLGSMLHCSIRNGILLDGLCGSLQSYLGLK